MLSWKKSALVWSEILTLFVNTLTAHKQVFPLQCAQFRATSSNAIISKIKDFLSIFYCISAMCIQFRTFWKKDEYRILIISEIMDCERGGYLNV